MPMGPEFPHTNVFVKHKGAHHARMHRSDAHNTIHQPTIGESIAGSFHALREIGRTVLDTIRHTHTAGTVTGLVVPVELLPVQPAVAAEVSEHNQAAA